MADLKRSAFEMSDPLYSRYMAMQRRLAPFTGTMACMVGLVFLVSAVAPNAVGMSPEMSVKERIIIGAVFEAVGLLGIRWGLKKTLAPKK